MNTPESSGPTHRLLRFQAIETSGIEAVDTMGNLWRTFSHGAPVRCLICGATITRGWARPTPEMAICSAHVELIGVR